MEGVSECLTTMLTYIIEMWLMDGKCLISDVA